MGMMQVAGLANNCYCNSSALNMPLQGGYLDFENYSFYLRNYNSVDYWAAGAIVGGSVPSIAFVVALFWWLKCRHLWKANERRGHQLQQWGVYADTRWLQ